MSEWNDADFEHVLMVRFKERHDKPHDYETLLDGDGLERAMAVFRAQMDRIQGQLDYQQAGLNDYTTEWRISAVQARRHFKRELDRLKTVQAGRRRKLADVNREVNLVQAAEGKKKRAEDNRRVAAQAQHMRELVYVLATRLVAAGGAISDLVLFADGDDVGMSLPDWLDVRGGR